MCRNPTTGSRPAAGRLYVSCILTPTAKIYNWAPPRGPPSAVALFSIVAVAARGSVGGVASTPLLTAHSCLHSHRPWPLRRGASLADRGAGEVCMQPEWLDWQPCPGQSCPRSPCDVHGV
eukprot:scaffold3941_cov412-Prasinococcus_capsulatus_cf.AAC.4